MRVFVTGGAGFIGRVLVRMLVQAGHQVVSLDSLRFTEADRKDPKLFPQGSVDWIWGDTRNLELLTSLIPGCDAVIHLAAPSSMIMHLENDVEACEFTLMGFKKVMETARVAGIRHVVWASTSAVYEGNSFPYREDMPLDPPDSKAGCKKFCEEEARRYFQRFGMNFVAMRPFSVYGMGEHTKRGYANTTSLFCWAMMGGEQPIVWGDGTQTRDYIYVEDVARAFLMALEALVAGKIKGTEEFNLGTGVETTFNDVIRIIGEELGIKPQPRYVERPRRVDIYAERLLADTAKIERVLAFKPVVDVREGVSRVIAATQALPQEVQQKLVRQQYYCFGLDDKK